MTLRPGRCPDCAITVVPDDHCSLCGWFLEGSEWHREQVRWAAFELDVYRRKLERQQRTTRATGQAAA